MKFHISHNGCEPSLVDLTEIRNKLVFIYGLKESIIEQADILIFLGCTFSNQKENEVINKIQQFQSFSNKLIVISGCYLKRYIENKNTIYTKPQNVVGEIVSYYNLEKIDYDLSPSEIPLLQISSGCYGKCTFCSIKFVKGKHKSVPLKNLMDKVDFLQDKFNAIKLVGQDIAGYGIDCNSSLYELLSIIFNNYPKLQIELGSLNPNLLKNFSDNELSILTNPNIIGNLHVPLQSASNRILKLMNRNYSFEDYNEILNKLRSYGALNISTDIIAGFPTEKNEDHLDNINFIRNTILNFAQIFMYDIRMGTPAEKMKQLPREIKAKRTTDLISEFIISYAKFNNLTYSEIINLSNERLFNTNINLNTETVEYESK